MPNAKRACLGNLLSGSTGAPMELMVYSRRKASQNVDMALVHRIEELRRQGGWSERAVEHVVQLCLASSCRRNYRRGKRFVSCFVLPTRANECGVRRPHHDRPPLYFR